jgi:hypothetical protein
MKPVASLKIKAFKRLRVGLDREFERYSADIKLNRVEYATLMCNPALKKSDLQVSFIVLWVNIND